jgi:hypothetical protein
MADPIKVANSAEQLEGKTVLTAEDYQAVTGQKTFNRAPSPPFEVQSGSGTVANLDADKLDGEEGAAYHNASNLNAGIVPADRIPDPLPAKSGENLTNLDAQKLTGVVPDAAVPDPLPAVSGENLTDLPNPLPTVSGENLTNLNASNLASGTVPGARLPDFAGTISRGGTFVNPNGITAAINIIVWRAPFACTVTKVWGYRVGGTGATVNARKNGASNHLASALSLTSGGGWMDGGAVQNQSYAAGDKLEIMIVTVAGSPTQVGVQVDFTPA